MSTAPDLTKTLGNGVPYLGSFAFASLPVATSWNGFTAIASDVGIAPGMLLISDGVRWMPLGPQVLARSAVAVTAPADTSADILATIAVPGGLLGVNGSLRVNASFLVTSSTNAKTFTVQYGGTTLFNAGVASLGIITCRIAVTVNNRNNASVQIGGADDYGIGGGTQNFTSAINSATGQNLTILGTKASAGETLTLDKYTVEALP